jgi:hypothetical protein
MIQHKKIIQHDHTLQYCDDGSQHCGNWQHCADLMMYAEPELSQIPGKLLMYKRKFAIVMARENFISGEFT